MKRVILAVVVALISFTASAQYFGGVAFDIDYSSNSSKTGSSARHKDNEAYRVSIAPQFGWMPTERWMVGAAISFDLTSSGRLVQQS